MWFKNYLFLWTLLFLFPTWLVLHGLSAHIYRSAVLKVLRRGTIARQDLHPVLNRRPGHLFENYFFLHRCS